MTHVIFLRIETVSEFMNSPNSIKKEVRMVTQEECLGIAQQIDILIQALTINPAVSIIPIHFDRNCFVFNLEGISIKDFKALLDGIFEKEVDEVCRIPLLDQEFQKEEIGSHHLQVSVKKTSKVLFLDTVPGINKEVIPAVNTNFSNAIF